VEVGHRRAGRRVDGALGQVESDIAAVTEGVTAVGVALDLEAEAAVAVDGRLQIIHREDRGTRPQLHHARTLDVADPLLPPGFHYESRRVPSCQLADQRPELLRSVVEPIE